MEKGVRSSSAFVSPKSVAPDGACMNTSGGSGGGSKQVAAVKKELDIPVPHRGLIFLDRPYDQEDVWIVHNFI